MTGHDGAAGKSNSTDSSEEEGASSLDTSSGWSQKRRYKIPSSLSQRRRSHTHRTSGRVTPPPARSGGSGRSSSRLRRHWTAGVLGPEGPSASPHSALARSCPRERCCPATAQPSRVSFALRRRRSCPRSRDFQCPGQFAAPPLSTQAAACIWHRAWQLTRSPPDAAGGRRAAAHGA